MHSTRKIIRVFLASPGDLQDERKTIRDVVDEFNESWANELGYQVELIGWEETVAGYGRPQHLINQDLDRCDLFIGMIWKRWGTPPDDKGKFSSGFEEEFERSMERRNKTGKPEISLFFKQIPDEFKADPGVDLKKVLSFRKKIIDGKKILFQNFSTTQDIEKLARKCVTAFVNRGRAEDESSEPSDLRAKRDRPGSGEGSKEDGERESSPLFAEGSIFLESLVERIRQPNFLDTLSPADVARFRLLAYSISKPGNENMNLGVHDINILFAAYTEGMELGNREKSCLTSLGFQHLANENVPLWRWYSDMADSDIDPAVISSIFGGSEREKVGAISVLTSLAFDLSQYKRRINRDWIIKSWFSDDSSIEVRAAALRYLSKCGTAKDLEIAKKEHERSDYGTSRNAFECMVGILFRTGQVKAAQKLVLESQFESLNANLLSAVIESLDGLETPTLLLGLEHSNSKVRLHTMKTLSSRGALNMELANRMIGDSDAMVRREAIAVLNGLGRTFADEEIKRILVPPQKQSKPGFLGLASVTDSDKEGEKLFQQYQLDILKSLSKTELEKRVERSLVYDDNAYFALVEKYFRYHANKLRRDIDDRYSRYFEERIRRMEAFFATNADLQDLIKGTIDLKEYLCKKLTRRGLNLLCAALKPQDLQRIRGNLRDGYAGASIFDAKYLGRHGEWTDIPLLANAQGPTLGTSLLMMEVYEEFQLEVARAITSIGKKNPVSDLLSLQMPAAILKKTIDHCPESRFSKISRDALFSLFNHESAEVRKASAVLAVRAFSAKRIREVLHEYAGSDKYRFYNVIHWLDLGASMSRDVARKVALAVGI